MSDFFPNPREYVPYYVAFARYTSDDVRRVLSFFGFATSGAFVYSLMQHFPKKPTEFKCDAVVIEVNDQPLTLVPALRANRTSVHPFVNLELVFQSQDGNCEEFRAVVIEADIRPFEIGAEHELHPADRAGLNVFIQPFPREDVWETARLLLSEFGVDLPVDHLWQLEAREFVDGAIENLMADLAGPSYTLPPEVEADEGVGQIKINDQFEVVLALRDE